MWGALVQQLVRWRGVCPGGLLRYWAGADVEEGDMGDMGDMGDRTTPDMSNLVYWKMNWMVED